MDGDGDGDDGVLRAPAAARRRRRRRSRTSRALDVSLPQFRGMMHGRSRALVVASRQCKTLAVFSSPGIYGKKIL